MTRNSSGPNRPRIDAFDSSERRIAGHLEEGRVAGRVAVGVVDEPEVVDVDDGDTRPAPGPSAVGLELVGQLDDDRAVVEQPGQGVAPLGLEQGPRLALEAPVGGPEDEVQEHRQDRGREAGDADDPVAGRVGRVEDRRRVAVDLEDRADVAIGRDREVLLEDVLECCPSGRTVATSPSSASWMAAAVAPSSRASSSSSSSPACVPITSGRSLNWTTPDGE